MYTAFDPIFWHSVHFYLKSLLDLERRAFQMKHSSPSSPHSGAQEQSKGDIKNMEINKYRVHKSVQL